MQPDDKYAIWLSAIDEVNTQRYYALCEHYGSAQNVFENVRGAELKAMGYSEKFMDAIRHARVRSLVDDQMAILQKLGITYVLYGQPEYPDLLAQIYDPPPVLYGKGVLPLQLERAIAIVGTRKATRYGRKAARKIGRELAEAGITVVSGMAAGIDGEAQWGALEGNGYTVAVMGCGVERAYPASNRDLYEEICNRGAVVSEYFPGTEPLAAHFPARNRIMSGLSSGVVIVESPLTGGSLITVEFALEQNREVFAVPGNIDSPMSEGTLRLIREGCTPVGCGAHILEAFPQWGFQPVEEQVHKTPKWELNQQEQTIYQMLEEGELHGDYLAAQTGIPQGELSACLTMMEIRGIINKLPGGFYEINRG